jgi:hypothetical protein
MKQKVKTFKIDPKTIKESKPVKCKWVDDLKEMIKPKKDVT